MHFYLTLMRTTSQKKERFICRRVVTEVVTAGHLRTSIKAGVQARQTAVVIVQARQAAVVIVQNQLHSTSIMANTSIPTAQHKHHVENLLISIAFRHLLETEFVNANSRRDHLKYWIISL